MQFYKTYGIFNNECATLGEPSPPAGMRPLRQPQRRQAWIATVKRHGPTELRKALSAFRHWRQEILAFFDFLPTRLSNGFVEGKNNRTKALMRQGYGYPNRRHLRLRILLEVAS